MCRVLAYLGEKIHPANILYRPDNSLIKQSYAPQLMEFIQNLAGFGISIWDSDSRNPDVPFIYRTTSLPFYDINLKELAAKFESDCILAHIRGTPYELTQVINQQNIHPFLFADTKLAFAHNGDLAGLNVIKHDLIKYINNDVFQQIKGTTDSEIIYSIILSRLPDCFASDIPYKTIKNAILSALDIIRHVRAKHDIHTSSGLNFFISNGKRIIALRYTMDYGAVQKEYAQKLTSFHSMWYSFGKSYGYYQHEYQMLPDKKHRSLIIASEPLTHDNTTWLEVPEYSIFHAEKKHNHIDITIEDMPF